MYMYIYIYMHICMNLTEVDKIASVTKKLRTYINVYILTDI
jgi:hypothetical protein